MPHRIDDIAQAAAERSRAYLSGMRVLHGRVGIAYNLREERIEVDGGRVSMYVRHIVHAVSFCTNSDSVKRMGNVVLLRLREALVGQFRFGVKHAEHIQIAL